MRPGGRWVHPGLLGSLGTAVVVFGFFRCSTRVRPGGRWVHPVSRGSLGCVLDVVGFISDAPWGSLCSSGVIGFTRVRSNVCWVHLGPFGSIGCALGIVGSIRGRWVHSGAPWRSLDSSVFTRCALRVVGFTWVRLGIVVFTMMLTGCLWVHPGLLGTLGSALGEFRFMRG